MKEVDQLRQEALEECRQVKDVGELEAWRVRYLGKKSQLVDLLRRLGGLMQEERKELGARANELKVELEVSYKQTKKALNDMEIMDSLEKGALDITLPGKLVPEGRLHPISSVIYEVNGIFAAMGFKVVEGPEVETEYYNFDALNIPEEHPARDMMDTFWLEQKESGSAKSLLLRTHTSPMQIRYMEKTEPPIRIIVPGKVYRYEATDASHTPMFHQIEGLAIDKDISMADLKGVLYQFAHHFFGKERKVRFRCDYFPFVEPGAEMAIDCAVCKGDGCRVCGDSGWLEVLGAGMVHPNVLERGNVNPEKYQGFAFGMGIERLAMLRWGVNDIRLFYENDLRFLRQF